MVDLISKEQIAQLGIDTIERALVFSALSLESVLNSDGETSTLRDKVRVTTVTQGNDSLRLRIDALIPYNTDIYQSLGGAILPSIVEFKTQRQELETIPNYNATPTVPSDPIIPDFESSRITSFEQYFVFYCLLLLGALGDDLNSVITITPRSNSLDNPEIRIRVTLGLNRVVFALGGSFVSSVSREAISYPNEFQFFADSIQIGTMTNEDELSNNDELSN